MSTNQPLIHHIDSFEAFLALKQYSEEHQFEYFFYDTETDGLDTTIAQVFGIGFCFDVNESFYIPIKSNQRVEFWTPDQLTQIYSWIKHQYNTRKVVGHNILFDLLVSKQNEIFDFTQEKGSVYADTLLMKHTIDEEYPFGLKDVATKYFGADSTLAQEALYENIKKNGGKTTKENVEMWKADTEVLGHYCAWDCILTAKLFFLFDKRLTDEGLDDFFYCQEVMPLYFKVTCRMRVNGFEMDTVAMHNLSYELKTQIGKYEQIFHESIDIGSIEASILDKDYPAKFGNNARLTSFEKSLLLVDSSMDINTARINGVSDAVKQSAQKLLWEKGKSPDETRVFNMHSLHHLKRLFFDTLKEKSVSKTKKGTPQIDENFLDEMAKKYEFAQTLINIRKLSKLEGTYVSGILDVVKGTRVYPDWMQHGTTSGRYAATKPAIQTIPREKDDEAGLDPLVLFYVNKIKACFISRPGYSLVNADYSSLEPRCLPIDTKVVLNNKIRTIGDAKVGDFILTKFGHNKILNKWGSNKECLEFLTSRGRTVTSLDHKIWSITDSQWKKASEFKVGESFDFIPFKNITEQEVIKLPIHCQSALNLPKMNPLGFLELTNDLAWALGAFLGDGMCSYQVRTVKHIKRNGAGVAGYVGICGLEEDGVVQEFERIFNSYGYYFTSWRDSRNADLMYVQYSGVDLLNIFKNTFMLLGEVKRTTKKGNKNFVIPEYIFNANQSIKLAILAGLIDTDGTTGSRHENGKDLVLSTHNTKLASDLVLLFGTLEVNAKITYTIKDNKHFGCQVRVLSSGITRLVELGLLDHMRCHRKRDQLDIPRGNVKAALSADIKYIRSLPSQETVDIEVEGCHEFVAEGIRVHNCFAEASGDADLQNVFIRDEDLYSAIAIRVFKLAGYSSYPSDDNYLKKIRPEVRQQAKIFSLSVVYGSSAWKMAKLLNCEASEATRIINDYLNSYPGLKHYIHKCQIDAVTNGYITTKFGRKRHVPRAKELFDKYSFDLLDRSFVAKFKLKDEAYEFSKYMNLSRNFPIQGSAASVVNRSMIAFADAIKDNKLDAKIIANVHDEICVEVLDAHVEDARRLLEECMTQTVKTIVPMTAKPLTARNWRDAK